MSSEVPMTGRTIVRYSGTSSTTLGMNSVASTAPFSTGAYLGRSTDST